jgi:hypothetical protein
LSIACPEKKSIKLQDLSLSAQASEYVERVADPLPNRHANID